MQFLRIKIKSSYAYFIDKNENLNYNIIKVEKKKVLMLNLLLKDNESNEIKINKYLRNSLKVKTLIS